MTIRQLMRKIARNYNDYGLEVLLRKLTNSFVGVLFKREVMIIYGIDLGKCRLDHADMGGFVLKRVSAEDVRQIEQIEGIEEWLAGRLQSKLKGNGVCYVLLADEELVGFYIASRGSAVIPNLRCKMVLQSHEAWGEQITIMAPYRGGGISTALKKRVYAELKALGVRTIYGHAAPHNRASLGSVHKFPLKVVLRTIYHKYLQHNRLLFYDLSAAHKSGRLDGRFRRTGKDRLRRPVRTLIRRSHSWLSLGNRDTLFRVDTRDLT